MTKTGRVILPPNNPKIVGNVIFLAGPVIAAPVWQSEAIKIIKSLDKDVNIASPCYDDLDREYLEDNPIRIERGYDGRDWPEIDWQLKYRDLAFREGCELFWLPKENEVMHDCTYPYAMTTRGELFARLHAEGNLVIGRQKSFSGVEYIDYVFKKLRPQTPFCSSLEETCRTAVEIARKAR